MTKTEYAAIEAYMLSQMKDSVHDKYHVYRVVNAALNIADNSGEKVDLDVLLAASFLHDIGRAKQYANPQLCHAKVGSGMAYEFLLSQKWDPKKALHVKECIITHRFRRDNPPQSIEAKILFDADKLDVCGAIGIARTLMYSGQVEAPIYILGNDGNIVTDGDNNENPSFFHEYNYKLKNLYDSFFMDYTRKIAIERKKIATDFYNGLLTEINFSYKNGIKNFEAILEEGK